MGLAFCQRDELVRCVPKSCQHVTLCQVRMRQRIIYSTVTRAPSALAALAPHTHAPRARSCWTFATTSALSDRLRIHSRGAINVLLSAQNWLLL